MAEVTCGIDQVVCQWARHLELLVDDLGWRNARAAESGRAASNGTGKPYSRLEELSSHSSFPREPDPLPLTEDSLGPLLFPDQHGGWLTAIKKNTMQLREKPLE